MYGFPFIKPSELAILPDGEVIICIIKSSNEKSWNLLKEHNLWGFNRIDKNADPKYFALYVTAPRSSIEIFAEIDSSIKGGIIDPREEISPISKDVKRGIYNTLAGKPWYVDGKRIILLKKGSIRELSPPIKKGMKVVPRHFWYSDSKKFSDAKSIDDVL